MKFITQSFIVAIALLMFDGPQQHAFAQEPERTTKAEARYVIRSLYFLPAKTMSNREVVGKLRIRRCKRRNTAQVCKVRIIGGTWIVKLTVVVQSMSPDWEIWTEHLEVVPR